MIAITGKIITKGGVGDNLPHKLLKSLNDGGDDYVKKVKKWGACHVLEIVADVFFDLAYTSLHQIATPRCPFLP